MDRINNIQGVTNEVLIITVYGHELLQITFLVKIVHLEKSKITF